MLCCAVPCRAVLCYTVNNVFLVLILIVLCFSASTMDDLQMKELQDQLEAEQYFSVSLPPGTLLFQANPGLGLVLVSLFKLNITFKKQREHHH